VSLVDGDRTAVITGIPCPQCGYHQSMVTDSRHTQGGIRRRRRCMNCQHNFSTRETVFDAATDETTQVRRELRKIAARLKEIAAGREPI
jgi:transcriptional regulator NrdR family protein